MHTPESKRDAHLLDLGLDAEQLQDLGDLPVIDLDIPFVALDLPEPLELAPDVPVAPGSKMPTTALAALPALSSPKTMPITIRVPRAVVGAFKARAAPTGMGYQTLMVRALQEWLISAARRGSGLSRTT